MLPHAAALPRIGASAAAAAALALVAAPTLVAPASAASGPCPKTGRTLATSRTDDGASRVWRTSRGIFGCTTVGNASGRPDTWLLSRNTVGRLALDGDTVAFTQHAGGTPRTARRVTAIDLDSGQRFLRRQKAIPVEDTAGSREREGSVAGLRVLNGGYVGWIANGSIVVLAAVDPGYTIVAEQDGTTAEIHLSSNNVGSRSDGYTGVARRHPSSSAVARNLSRSLAIADTGSDPEDVGAYETTWSWTPDGTTTVRAVMTGTR